ncbi:hypothetical protein D3C72_2203710 [compost metagenome]
MREQPAHDALRIGQVQQHVHKGQCPERAQPDRHMPEFLAEIRRRQRHGQRHHHDHRARQPLFVAGQVGIAQP